MVAATPIAPVVILVIANDMVPVTAEMTPRRPAPKPVMLFRRSDPDRPVGIAETAQQPVSNHAGAKSAMFVFDDALAGDRKAEQGSAGVSNDTVPHPDRDAFRQPHHRCDPRQ